MGRSVNYFKTIERGIDCIKCFAVHSGLPWKRITGVDRKKMFRH
jgi:hypothetical protein